MCGAGALAREPKKNQQYAKCRQRPRGICQKVLPNENRT